MDNKETIHFRGKGEGVGVDHFYPSLFTVDCSAALDST
jgi:hypothetical protein